MNESDLLSWFFTTSWADLGGWGLFLGLVVFIVFGAFREWWVPGPRHHRTEALLQKSVETIQSLTAQNGQLITGNEITKHFFEETTPKRVVRDDNGFDGGDSS